MLKEKIGLHSAWRQDMRDKVGKLERWLEAHDLMTTEIKTHLAHMQQQNRDDKLMVAFVAEFSRGKSELINAIFFAGYGKRIMPASAGRTTMCPTELGYDEAEAPCLRLLPIQTRLDPQPLLEWRLQPQQWTRVDLDVGNADQLIAAMNKVSETIDVSVEDARALGFWSDGAEDNPIPNARGLVSVPRWRHALINMDHPLLRQGLVILDTPGLNAVGAEPELTMSLIPQAQAVVFILGADTGVTASDLSMWREFLCGNETHSASRFVVLNKIDTLWDDLSTPEQVQQQIERQRTDSAQMLGVAQDRVLTVSAQKGLLAKVNGDARLLRQSRLDEFEQLLGRRIVAHRQDILQSRFRSDLEAVALQVRRLLGVRRAELHEQLAELQGLHGKSDATIRQQRLRIGAEQEGFNASVSRAHAVRSIHHKTLQHIYGLLGSNQLKQDMHVLQRALVDSGFIKLGVRKAYADAFAQIQAHLTEAHAQAGEIHAVFESMFRQLNADFGFTLQADPPPSMDAYAEELAEIQRSHEQYLSVGNLLKLSQVGFSDRLLRALFSRVRGVLERALNDIEQWSKGVASQIDTQLRERRRGFKRRMAAVERAESATGELDARIRDVQQLDAQVAEQRRQFDAFLQEFARRPHAVQPAELPA